MIRRQRPSGQALVMTAVLMPVLIGFAAVSIDTGVVALSRAQLQTAADAAALAGAAKLGEAQIQGRIIGPTDVAAARAAAVQVASANGVLGAGAVLLPQTDVRVGYVMPGDPTQTFLTSTAWTAYYNTVKVVAARDATHGGVVPSFFGRASWINSQGTPVLNVRAGAVVQNGTGLRSIAGGNVSLLPIVLDKTTYEKMMKGQSFPGSTADGDPTDLYAYNDTLKTVVPGADGVAESKLYPVQTGDPGNWGTINVGVSANSTSTLGDQIRNGITPAQMATFPNSTIALDPALSPPSITFAGDPGISAGIKDDLTAIIGRPVTIPIYDQTGGNGNNAWFRVIAFARVRLLDVNFQGNPKYVIIQPALPNDPSPFVAPPGSGVGSGDGPILLHLSE